MQRSSRGVRRGEPGLRDSLEARRVAEVRKVLTGNSQLPTSRGFSLTAGAKPKWLSHLIPGLAWVVVWVELGEASTQVHSDQEVRLERG